MDDYPHKQLRLIKEMETKFSLGLFPSEVVNMVDDYEKDDRICLTSLFYLPVIFQKKIHDLLIKPLQEIDGRQYFFETEALHITVQNIKVVADPPTFTPEDVNKTKQVFADVTRRHHPIEVAVERIFQLPTSVALSVFTPHEWEELVMELREGLEKAGVGDDKSYAKGPVLANVTVCRYTTPPNDEFYSKLEALKEFELGSFTVDTIMLVTTNSVSLPSKTSVIEKYDLMRA